MYTNISQAAWAKVVEETKGDIHIMYAHKNRWRVKKRENTRASKVFKDKGEAIKYGLAIKTNRLIVHHEDGSIDWRIL